MRCDKCGLESPLDNYFRRERGSFGRKTQKLCPRCFALIDRQVAVAVMWLWLVLVVICSSSRFQARRRACLATTSTVDPLSCGPTTSSRHARS